MEAQCYACKESIGDDLFCLHCGTLQRCMTCGQAFQFAGKFCGSCGTERGQSPGEPTLGSSQPAQSISKEPAQQVQANQPTGQMNDPVSEQASSVKQVPLQEVSQGNASAGAAIEEDESAAAQRVVWIVVGIFAVAIISYVYFFLNPGPKTPEATAESFLEAVIDRNERKIKSYVLPASRDSLLGDLDYDELPYGIAIEFEQIEVVDYYDDYNMADVEVVMKLGSTLADDIPELYLDLEMVKVKNKWLIADIY